MVIICVEKEQKKTSFDIIMPSPLCQWIFIFLSVFYIILLETQCCIDDDDGGVVMVECLFLSFFKSSSCLMMMTLAFIEKIILQYFYILVVNIKFCSLAESLFLLMEASENKIKCA